MIDPKQKALEITEMYKNYVHGYVGSSMLTNTEYPEQILKQAKECAKIHVKGILDASPLEPSEEDWDDCGSNYADWYYERRLEAETYWQEVLNELNKL